MSLPGAVVPVFLKSSCTIGRLDSLSVDELEAGRCRPAPDPPRKGNMAVYIDNMFASYGRMKMCHMIADSTEELLAMADRIGVQRKWIQHAGTYKEHFDVSKERRERAIAFGAIPITYWELGHKLAERAKSMNFKGEGKDAAEKDQESTGRQALPGSGA